jgi:hypothetical protein
LDEELKIKHGKISAEKLYGISPASEDLFFSFESQYTPYQQLVIGTLPRIDLVTQSRSIGQVLQSIELKLTAIPDNSTCHLSEENYGCEIVIRPDTIVYLACSIAKYFKDKRKQLIQLFDSKFGKINDWSDGATVWPYIPEMISTIDKIVLSVVEKQEPILLQPIWKTIGKSVGFPKIRPEELRVNNSKVC